MAEFVTGTKVRIKEENGVTEERYSRVSYTGKGWRNSRHS